MGDNQSFSPQMEIMNDRFIVVLENEPKVIVFLALVIFVAIRLGVIASIARSILQN